MLFQSYIFILLFFPLCLLGFWGLKRQKLLQLWLIAFSLWFYGAASPYYLLLLLGSIAWNYAFFRAIERGIGRVTERVSGSAMERAEYGMERDSSRKKLLLGIGIAGNLALLCFFKYFNAISAGWSQMKGLIPVDLPYPFLLPQSSLVQSSSLWTHPIRCRSLQGTAAEL